MTSRRAAVLVALVIAVVAFVATDRNRAPRIDPVFTVLGDPTMPFVPHGELLTASWFCPGVPAGEGLGGAVVVANPSDAPVQGTVTAFTDAVDVAAASKRITVEPRATLEVDLGALQPTGTFLSALVELAGGAGFVEQRADHPAGSAVAPCANSTSDEWTFADGFTMAGSTEQLVITNPYPAPAIVNFRFATVNGVSEPGRLQGFVVEGRSVAVVDQSSLPRDEAMLAARVTATRGRVVVARAEDFKGGGRAGFTMSLGAPALSDQYYFVDGEVGQGITATYSIYNGSDQAVDVDAVFLGIPVDPAATTQPDYLNLQPIRVEPRQVRQFTVSKGDGSDVKGVPDGKYSLVFSTFSARSIVVERALTRPAGDGIATTVVLGAPGSFASQRWSMAVGTSMAVPDVLRILNATGLDGTVTVKSIGPGGETPITGLTDLALAPNGLLSVDFSNVDRAILGRPLVVEATQNILVERLLPRAEGLRGRSGSFPLNG